MNYTPNWADPRAIKRLEKALGWADLFLLPWRPAEASNKTLAEVFGIQSNPLSEYLRDKLLIEGPGGYRVGQYAKRWCLNKQGRDELMEILRRHQQEPSTVLFITSTQYAKKTYGDELSTLTFQYEDKASRLWHPLQNIRRENKQAFWSEIGLPHDYDIVACAPTILFQLARKNGVPEIVLAGLRGYLDDRSAFRQHVASLVEIDPIAAKKLINSLFNGARLGANPRWAAFKLLDYDTDKMNRLVNDPLVRKLRADIKRLWRGIERGQRAVTILSLDETLAGKEQANWKLTSAKDKWALYFRFERQVLDAITSYLTKTGNRHFTEHDGFRTEHEVDRQALQAWIKEKTGFEMVVEHA